jgi:transposase-like protein
VVYTTNTIAALNRQIRKTIKTRGRFRTDDAPASSWLGFS